MATVAAAAAAVGGLYAFLRRGSSRGQSDAGGQPPSEALAQEIRRYVESPPNTFAEGVLYVNHLLR